MERKRKIDCWIIQERAWLEDWLKEYWSLPMPSFRDYGLSGVLLILAIGIGKIILFPLVLLIMLSKYIPFVASLHEDIGYRRKKERERRGDFTG